MRKTFSCLIKEIFENEILLLYQRRKLMFLRRFQNVLKICIWNAFTLKVYNYDMHFYTFNAGENVYWSKYLRKLSYFVNLLCSNPLNLKFLQYMLEYAVNRITICFDKLIKSSWLISVILFSVVCVRTHNNNLNRFTFRSRLDS